MRHSNRARASSEKHGNRQKAGAQGPGKAYWLFGTHAVSAAIRNKNRTILQVLATEDAASALRKTSGTPGGPIRVEIGLLDPRSLPPGLAERAVHQGLVAQVLPLPEPDAALLEDPTTRLVVVLDQVTDPQNIGTILRNCAVFGVDAVVAPRHHTPRETGALAKAASGALEIVPVIRVANLSRTIDRMKKAGFFVVGLDGNAQTAIADYAPLGRCALVAGAEGSGLRRLVSENCDATAALPVAERARAGGVDSLNVGVAIAVALHELVRHQ
ncbi:MAG: RNA methyltransferase [Proteobacteria bacterium]|nr:RNA methyltransferase [Pseudomonadota bacterium]MDA1059798.1 RNA methyltransferase [Pseudomonadota bacterium]